MRAAWCFSLHAEETLFDGALGRLAKLMGRDFADNAAKVAAARESVRLWGFAGLPTYNRANAQMQFLFVNGRPVRDRLLLGAVKGAYADYLARDRHPAVALFIECDPVLVDVNVHPAKAEVRFRDSGLVRGLIVGALKAALHEASHRASTTVADAAFGAFPAAKINWKPCVSLFSSRLQILAARIMRATLQALLASAVSFGGMPPAGPHALGHDHDREHDHASESPLGVARAQRNGYPLEPWRRPKTAHTSITRRMERTFMERMKQALENGGVKRQNLLIPEIVEMDESEASRVLARSEELSALGLVVESFGPGALLVREVPRPSSVSWTSRR